MCTRERWRLPRQVGNPTTHGTSVQACSRSASTTAGCAKRMKVPTYSRAEATIDDSDWRSDSRLPGSSPLPWTVDDAEPMVQHSLSLLIGHTRGHVTRRDTRTDTFFDIPYDIGNGMTLSLSVGIGTSYYNVYTTWQCLMAVLLLDYYIYLTEISGAYRNPYPCSACDVRFLLRARPQRSRFTLYGSELIFRRTKRPLRAST